MSASDSSTPGALALQIEDVSRTFPRDVSRIASAVAREMLLPLPALRRCPPGHFHALRHVSLSLAAGEKAIILGAHRSGKSVLAGIAAGSLRPTSGQVTARGSRLLLGKPAAGFRPGLTVRESLTFRVALQGLTGEHLRAVVDRTLAACRMSDEQAGRANGNYSPFIIKQLAYTLLLELPADILIVDEATGGGTGDARWELLARLRDKIQSSTSVVFSADTSFAREGFEQAWLLHSGRLYGPFGIEQAVEAFDLLPPEHLDTETEELYDPLAPPRGDGSGGAFRGYAGDQDDGSAEMDDIDPLDQARARPTGPPWRARCILVDGEEFSHSRYSLVRRPGSVIQVTLELASGADQDFTGGLFALHGGNSRMELARYAHASPPIPVLAGETIDVSFEFEVPDWDEDFFGLSFCPYGRGGRLALEHRLKVLLYGVGQKHDQRPERTLDIRISSIERKLKNASPHPVPALPTGEGPAREVVG